MFVIDQSELDFLEVGRAEYLGYSRQLQREREALFVPSMRTGTASQSLQHTTFPIRQKMTVYTILCNCFTVSASGKLPENVRPRYLEEEGLYVGERPSVSLTNQNILENRILKEAEVMILMVTHFLLNTDECRCCDVCCRAGSGLEMMAVLWLCLTRSKSLPPDLLSSIWRMSWIKLCRLYTER